MKDRLCRIASVLASKMSDVHWPDPDAYWPSWQGAQTTPSPRRFEGIPELEGGEIGLGFYLTSHIGDALCASTLPRKLATRYGCKVYVVNHRSTRNVFAENPYVSGFRSTGDVSLSQCLAGPGHLIQKLERFFGLPSDPYPRPEIYLSDTELQWAWGVRSQWPADRPVVLLSTGALTDSRAEKYATMGWQDWVDAVAPLATVVQLALTDMSCYEEAVAVHDFLRPRWEADALLRNCAVLENLPPRRFLAIFAVADMHVGPTAAGCQIAAAMRLPSLVVLNAANPPEKLRFPNPDDGAHNTQSFLYPQHVFAYP